jgi:hypothetical protein
MDPNLPFETSAVSLGQRTKKRGSCFVLGLAEEHLAGITEGVLARPTGDEQSEQGGNEGASDKFIGEGGALASVPAGQQFLRHDQRARVLATSSKAGVVEPRSQSTGKSLVDGLAARFWATKDV